MEDFKSKWIKFIDYTMPKKNKHGHIVSYPKTQTFLVRNKESDFVLGEVKWYGPFRQYSFFPAQNTVFEKTCMSDITRFIIQLMNERALKRAGQKSLN